MRRWICILEDCSKELTRLLEHKVKYVRIHTYSMFSTRLLFDSLCTSKLHRFRFILVLYYLQIA